MQVKIKIELLDLLNPDKHDVWHKKDCVQSKQPEH